MAANVQAPSVSELDPTWSIIFFPLHDILIALCRAHPKVTAILLSSIDTNRKMSPLSNNISMKTVGRTVWPQRSNGPDLVWKWTKSSCCHMYMTAAIAGEPPFLGH